ncbi:hypothetical protein ACLMJK_001658 [Lecanora helva]
MIPSHRDWISRQLGSVVTGTVRERQSFEYFHRHIGHELSSALRIDPAYGFILQASQSDDVVKSAVIAIGSMGQRLRINQLLTSDNQQANALQEFAQVQYCKALNQLQARMGNDPEQSTELAIIACFLFTILEFLQGNEVDALVHLRSGLSILRREKGFQEPTDPLRMEISEIFSIMDRQATWWLGLKSFQSPVIVPIENLAPAPLSFSEFQNLDEAAGALNYHLTQMYHFRRCVTASDPTLRNIPQEAYTQQKEMLDQLERWPAGFATLLSSLNEAFVDVEIIHRAAVMQMNYRTIFVLLSSCFEGYGEQRSNVSYETDFQLILSLAKSVVGTTEDSTKGSIERVVAANNRGRNPVPLFTFHAGVIQPLYILAITCRDLNMCQEAIALLSAKPWREGAWDSFSMAMIAKRRIQQLKDQGYYDNEHAMSSCISTNALNPINDGATSRRWSSQT